MDIEDIDTDRKKNTPVFLTAKGDYFVPIKHHCSNWFPVTHVSIHNFVPQCNRKNEKSIGTVWNLYYKSD